MRNLLCELLKVSLCGGTIQPAPEEEWQQCYNMLLAQNVLAMTFPAMTALPKDLRPSFLLWSKWLAYAYSIDNQTQFKRRVVEKMGSWMVEEGLSTLILKGFSLSALYPNPNLREFGDIDIFSGENYDAVNTCFAKHGVIVGRSDGHHAYLKIDGISIEHHFAFHNTKVRRGLEGPEEALQELAVKDWRPTSIKGISFPNSAFTALFVGWHAYEHFLQEKIQLRHVIDWVLALRQLSESDSILMNEAKVDSRWGKFTNTLTAIALHQLNLPQDWFPQIELEAANTVSSVQEQKVWDDITTSPFTPHSRSSNLRRINIAKRMLRNGWKYKTYSNISASRLVLKEAVGFLKSKVKRPQT